MLLHDAFIFFTMTFSYLLLLLLSIVTPLPSCQAFFHSSHIPSLTVRNQKPLTQVVLLVVPITSSTSTRNYASKKSNDAFLSSLEEMDGSEPSPESLASLREVASSRIAKFLASFSSSISDKETNNGKNNNSDDDNESSSLKNQSLSSSKDDSNTIEWDVYVCLSKNCKERGASATLDTFQSLAPPSLVQVHPSILSKSKGRGPNIRCIQRHHPFRALEVNNVNDIDKVYRILTQHMNIPNISIQARECLKYTYEGNAHLEKNELSQAIASYNAALATKYEPQEGILLLLRATAYLKRAFAHQVELRKTVNDLSDTVPDPAQLGRLYQVAAQHPSLSKPLFHKVLNDCKVQDKKFRQTKYRHGLYEYALLHAAQDALRSTQLLPHHAKTWLRAGDALAELRKLKESVLYYQKAIELDPTLRERLEPVIERLERSQMFLEKAKGWYSSDVLRLALDVAG